MTFSRKAGLLALSFLFWAGCSASPDGGPAGPESNASFTFAPVFPAVGQDVQFTDASTGHPNSWLWDFGDGATSTSQNPVHSFASEGAKTVTLTAGNSRWTGRQTRTAFVMTVMASFKYKPALPAPGRAVEFTDASRGAPISWQWDFGDGTTSTEQNPSHVFSAERPYVVSLVAQNAMGSDIASRTIDVTTEDILPTDRLTDWSYAGVPGGIPNRTSIFRTLQPGASAAEINGAIAAASGSGMVVYLAAGTYDLSAPIDMAFSTDLTVRGAGAGKTIINSTFDGDYAIASASTDYIGPAVSGGVDIVSGYAKGSTSIRLGSAPPAAFRVGNLIQIVQDDDYELVFHRTDNWAGARNLRHNSRITAVAGNLVSFATPIPHSFRAVCRPQANARPANARLVGLEDLSIQANGKLAVAFGGADRCWIKGVETSGTENSAIEFRGSSQCEVRRCYVHDADGFPEQLDGYGVFLFYGTSYCRVEDNIGNRMANLLMMNGASGNAILYNYFHSGGRAGLEWLSSSINSNHGPHGIMNLFEGNIIARFKNDAYHGSASHGLLFRNQIHGLDPDGDTQERRLIDLCRGSYYHSVIGNIVGDASWTPDYYELYGSPGHSENGCIYVLGYPNLGNTSLSPETDWDNYLGSYPDTTVAETLLRHGNYDSYHRHTLWDNDIVAHDIPDSLVYASKPAFFGSLPWPPIGPDVDGLVTPIPAKARWDAYAVSGNLDDLFRD